MEKVTLVENILQSQRQTRKKPYPGDSPFVEGRGRPPTPINISAGAFLFPASWRSYSGARGSLSKVSLLQSIRCSQRLHHASPKLWRYSFIFPTSIVSVILFTLLSSNFNFVRVSIVSAICGAGLCIFLRQCRCAFQFPFFSAHIGNRHMGFLFPLFLCGGSASYPRTERGGSGTLVRVSLLLLPFSSFIGSRV